MRFKLYDVYQKKILFNIWLRTKNQHENSSDVISTSVSVSNSRNRTELGIAQHLKAEC